MEITGEMSESHLKKFAATIYHLAEEEHIQFDVIVGSGNTGILCAKFTEIIYEKLGKIVPPILQIPVLRYKGAEKPENLFDNSILYTDIEAFLRQHIVSKLENVLFVDDEIYGGNALKACMRILIEYKKQNDMIENTLCYVVAEDQGLSSEFSISDAKIKFYPFEIGIDGTSNVLTYFMPFELEKPIEEALGESIGSHTIINILLGLPIRDKREDIIKPEFSYTFNKLAAEKIQNLPDLQSQAYRIVNNLLEKGIEEYKDNKFRLPFQSKT